MAITPVEAGVAVVIGTGAVVAVAFTADQWVTLGGIAVLVIGAISAAAVAIITAIGKTRQELEAIKHSVDGTASKAAEKNDEQARELKDFMLSVLAEKEKRAEILASAAADAMAAAGNRTRGADPAPPVATEPAVIEKNTQPKE